MARTQVSFLILSVLVLVLALPYASADDYDEEPLPMPTRKAYTPATVTSDVVVEGMVYCQSCKHSGTWSLSDAKPIAGAKVSVTCRNYKERIFYYNFFTTNDDGYFYAQLDGFKMRHPYLDHPLQSCTVKLVSSPLEDCNDLTNINYGINGAQLRSEKKRIMGKNYEAVIYAAGPLAFRNDECAPDQD